MARAPGSQFRNLGNHIGELAQIPSRIARPIAEGISAELRKQFEQGSDPYGVPWRTLAPYTIRKKGHDLILIEHGDLERDTHARPASGAGVELVSNEIGQFHQTGTERMPARQIFPYRAELPIAWQRIIREEYERAFRKVMRR